MNLDLLKPPFAGILSQYFDVLQPPKPAEVPHFAEVYARAWTPRQHFDILHPTLNGAQFLYFKVQNASLPFWDRMEFERVARRDEERAQRVAAGGKAGGKAKARPFFVYQAGKVVELSFADHHDDIYCVLDQLAGVPDVYGVQNCFFSRRQIISFMLARQMYIDLDHIKFFYGLTDQQVACLVLAYCDEIQIPRPSFIMSTGVGICAVWRHTEVHCARAWSPREFDLGHWDTTIKELTAVFDRRFVVDHSAKDVSRILRLAGTVNSKSGAVVHPVYVNGSDENPEVHDFGSLSFAISLAYASERKISPAEIVDRNVEPPEQIGLEPLQLTPEQREFKKAWLQQRKEAKEAREVKKRVKEAQRSASSCEGVIETDDDDEAVASVQVVPLISERARTHADTEDTEKKLAAWLMSSEDDEMGRLAAEQIARVATKNPRYAGVLSDLYLLLRHRGGRLAQRCDNWLFCATVCLGHGGYYGDALKAEVLKMRSFVSLDEDEALEFMSTTMRLADGLASGTTRPRPAEHVGSWDALYHLKNAAIRERLCITERELQTVPFMYIHRSGAADDAKYQREKKAIARGQTTRPQSRSEKAAEREVRNAQIVAMAVDGHTVRAISQALGVSVGTVSGVLKSQSSAVERSVQVVPLISEERGEHSAEEEKKVRQKYVEIARKAYDLRADSDALPEIYEEAVRYELDEIRRQRERRSLVLTSQ